MIARCLGALLVATAGLVGAAQAQDRPSENDMFGAPAAAPASEPVPATATPSGGFGTDSPPHQPPRALPAPVAATATTTTTTTATKPEGDSRDQIEFGGAGGGDAFFGRGGAGGSAEDRRPDLFARAKLGPARPEGGQLDAGVALPARRVHGRAAQRSSTRFRAGAHHLRPDLACDREYQFLEHQWWLAGRIFRWGHRQLELAFQLPADAHAYRVARSDVAAFRHQAHGLRHGRPPARALGHGALLDPDGFLAHPAPQPARRVRCAHRNHHDQAARALGGAGLELLRLRLDRGSGRHSHREFRGRGSSRRGGVGRVRTGPGCSRAAGTQAQAGGRCFGRDLGSRFLRRGGAALRAGHRSCGIQPQRRSVDPHFGNAACHQRRSNDPRARRSRARGRHALPGHAWIRRKASGHRRRLLLVQVRRQ